MSLLEKIELAIWRWRYAWAKRQADKRIAKRDMERSRDFYQRGPLAIVACLALASCGPSPATRTAIDEGRRITAECEQHASEIAENATSLAEGRAALDAERARCVAVGCGYCAAHHLDCASVGLVCPEVP